MDRQLLLAQRWSEIQQKSHVGEEILSRRIVETVDEFFDSLGDERPIVREAVEKVACLV
jgi:hypothetical protein